MKYLRSLRSHVYRFISNRKSKTHRRGELGGGKAGVDRSGAALDIREHVCRAVKNQIQPILTQDDARC